MDALKDFPDYDTKLITEKGDAVCQKQDIFKGLMWFAYTNNFANWHVLKIDQVKEIIAENKQKNKVSSLEDFAVEVVAEPEKDFNNAMGQESLTRFDQPKRKKKPNRKRKQNAEAAIVATPAKPQQEKNVNHAKPAGNTNPNNGNANKPNNQNNPNKQNHKKKHNSNKNNPNKQNSNENKPAEPRKPITNTKNENKK